MVRYFYARDNADGCTRQACNFRDRLPEIKKAGAHIVEIDLIRQGMSALVIEIDRLPPGRRTPYLIAVRRATDRSTVEVYPVALQERLPNIRVPLRREDEDIVLSIQPLIDQCYEDGGYGTTDYRADPPPRLSESDRDWLDRLLKERGLR